MEKGLYHKPAPWKKALKWFASEMEALDIPWIVFGSVAMALWGIEVSPEPNNINISFRDYRDYEKIRQHFAPYAIHPFGTCTGWFYSGFASLHMEDTPIGLVVENEGTDLDRNAFHKVDFEGYTISLDSLQNLRDGNLAYGRLDRAHQIEMRMLLE